MNRFIVLRIVVLTCLAVTAAVGILWLRDTSRPKLSISESVVEFGLVQPGQILQRTVVLRNSGKRLLQLEALRTSCACTALEVETDLLPAGGESKVLLQMVAPRSRGAVTERVIVHSNDRQQPVAVIELQAFVEPAFDISPEKILFGHIREHELPAEQRLIVRKSTEDEPLIFRGGRIVSLDVVSEHFGQVELVVSLPEDVPGGTLVDSIYIQRGSEVAEVPVTSRIIRDYRLMPDVLHLGGEYASAEVKVVGREPGDHILRLEASVEPESRLVIENLARNSFVVTAPDNHEDLSPESLIIRVFSSKSIPVTLELRVLKLGGK